MLTHTIKTVGSDHIGGVVLRYGDTDNYVVLSWRQNSTTFRYQLNKRVAATTSAVGTSAATVLSADGDVVRVTLAGTLIVVNVNGTDVITATVAEFTANTRHGLWGSNAGSNGSVDAIDFAAA